MICEETIYFDAQKEIVDQEIKEITQEQEAFISLSNDFEELESAVSTTRKTPYVNQERGNNIQVIKQLYSERILELPHYSEAYDEDLRQHMMHELGKGLIIAIEQSSDFYPKLKQALISAAVSSAENRTNFKQKLEQERDNLKEFEEELNKICAELSSITSDDYQNNDFNGLRYSHARLTELFTECEELSAQRQKKIQKHNTDPHLKRNGQIETYLYSQCENTYPVLSVIAEISDFIQQNIHTIENSISKLPVE